MKIVAFVGETFYSNNGSYYTKQTSAAFIQDAIGTESVYVCSPSQPVDMPPKGFSTVVQEEHFYSFPSYSSTKDFALKSIFNRDFINSYKAKADKVINEHKGAYFWIRTPSIGSIIFGIQALKAGEKVIHHMCANASSTWRDNKYSLPEKLFGFLFSRYLRFKLGQICKHKNTINLCTGDVLEDFSAQYSPANTFQFVDLMAKAPKCGDVVESRSKPLKVLFLGRIVKDKGVLDLISVANKLKGLVEITIIGDGPDLIEAQQEVEKLSLQESVHFTGQLSHSHLGQYFKNTSLVVVPSNNHYEGFPRVIMEAWAHQKPVIVSHVGGIKAFVKHGENGLIFKPGSQSELYDSLLSLVENENLYSHLEVGAQNMAKYSNQQYWLDRLLTIIKEKK